MDEKKRKRYAGVLRDVEKANKMLFRCFTLCAFVYALIGIFIFSDPSMNPTNWKVALYYFLLFLPMLIGTVERRERREAEEFRYGMYLPALGFYFYLLMLDRGYLYFIMAVCLIGLSVIYCDTRFSKMVGYVLFGLHIISKVILYFTVGDAGGARIFQALGVLVLSYFVNFSADLMLTIQKSGTKEVRAKQQHIETLLSVGNIKLFEYNPAKDVIKLTGTESVGWDYTRKIERFSEIAKPYRYVLYADWSIFDTFINESRLGTEKFSLQMRLRNRKGDYCWYQIHSKTVRDENGKIEKIMGTIENIDELKRYELMQLDENMRDPLSKLYKRAYAKQLMAEFLKQADKSTYAGLLLINIDDFGRLCKEKGERFGDELIRSMASDLDAIFHTSDILGRIGGDEFIVLMKYMNHPKDIEKKIKELQEFIRNTYTEEQMNFSSTVSIGASVYPTDDEDFSGLYRKAEKALAYAKEQGKDNYGFYDPTKEEEYNKSYIDARYNKIQQINEHEVHNVTENLTELAFRLIEESKDTDSAINLILRQVAREMNLNAIFIRRRIGKEHRMTYPYRCAINIPLKDMVSDEVMTDEAWAKEEKYLRTNNGVIFYTAPKPVEEEKKTKAGKTNRIKSFARSAFFEQGEYIGSLDFLDCTNEREWTDEDKRKILSLTNVISSYLLKMKAFEDASDTVEKLTGYDMITDFYKYEKFLDFTEEYLANAEQGKYAIIYVDFSNFKYINEMYGYEVGDKILKAYADEARKFKDIFIAGSRVFSDNMVCLIRVVWESEERMRNRLELSGELFAKKVRRKYVESNLALAIGVCTFDVDGNEIVIPNIISNANFARKEAKKPDNPNCMIYSEEMGERMRKEVSYLNDMDAAFANNEFIVYMQPKIDLKSHTISGAEALIRWIKTDGTMVFPNEFIPVFEKNKTISQLDYFVYEQVCKYLAERIARNERQIYVSMNVSRIHLNNVNGLVEYVEGLLRKYQIPPQLLEFELTETVMTDKVDDTVELMSRLRGLGVKVSIDDFGSGYSSLNILTKLPLDVLKLDKEFLKDFETDKDGKIIIPSIIDMAKKLDLSVVCEGVETKQQVEFLRQVDCDLVQGYYYSRPVPMKMFSQMLADDDFVINHETEV